MGTKGRDVILMDKKNKKKLSIMVGMALGFSIAFGGMPSDALAMTVTKDASASMYLVDGTSVTEAAMIADVKAALAQANNTVSLDKESAQALNAETITLGAGTTFSVASSSGSSATVVGGSQSSTIEESNGVVSGSNVSLKSLTIDNKGTTEAVSKLTGTVETVNVQDGTLKAASGALQVTNLTVSSGGSLTATGGMVTAATTTVASGATLTAAAGTLKTTNLVIESGAAITSGTTVSADTVTVDANASSTLANLTVSSASGTAVNIVVENAADAAAAATIANQVNTTAGTTKTVSQSIKITSNGSTYTVDGTSGVSEADLVSKIGSYAKGTTVTLDKAAASALQGTDLKIPAGVTVVVSDGTNSVSATAKTASTVQVNGLSLSGTDGASFSNVTIDAGSNAVTNHLKNATVDTVTVKSGTVTTDDVTAATLIMDGGSLTTAGTLTATTVTVNDGTVNAAAVKADTVTVNAGTIAAGSTIDAKTVTVNGGSLSGATVKASDGVTVSNVAALAGSTLDTAKVTVTTAGALTDAEKAAIAAVVPDGTSVAVTDSTGATTTVPGTKGNASAEPTEATTKALDAYKAAIGQTVPALPDSASALASNPMTVYAAQAAKNETVNPFTTKISTASDVAGVPAAVQNYNDAVDSCSSDVTAYNTSVDAYNQALTDASSGLSSITPSELAKYNAVNGTSYATVADLQKALSDKQLSAIVKLTDAQAASTAAALQSSIQTAGRTLAAPAVSSARSVLAVSHVLASNVVNRTADLREGMTGLASAVEERSSESPDNLWFQIKHGNMDVDDSDIYGKSKVKYTNYQLGYDRKVGPNDYVGGFLSSTTGSVGFHGLTADGTVDIRNAYGAGLYGTHILPNHQYIDAMLQTGTMDSKYADTSWSTKNFGMMIGYGATIEATKDLKVNPYVHLSYDRIRTDDAVFSSGNTVSADTQNNIALKLGVNLRSASGLYGGAAYSRGLSGDYSAYVNGVAMPSSDNKANVIYLSLGYRGNIGPNSILDISAEKTFMDYTGWNLAGRVNFLF